MLHDALSYHLISVETKNWLLRGIFHPSLEIDGAKSDPFLQGTFHWYAFLVGYWMLSAPKEWDWFSSNETKFIIAHKHLTKLFQLWQQIKSAQILIKHYHQSLTTQYYNCQVSIV